MFEFNGTAHLFIDSQVDICYPTLVEDRMIRLFYHFMIVLALLGSGCDQAEKQEKRRRLLRPQLCSRPMPPNGWRAILFSLPWLTCPEPSPRNLYFSVE